MTQEIYLQPGEIHYGGGDVMVTTLLGSCVAIVIWHERLHVGGMCHFMLPSRAAVVSGQWDGRYADEALAIFKKEITKQRTPPKDYRVAVFGGGDMFPSIVGSGLDVGPRNVRAGHKLLRLHGFVIHQEDVGGIGHRRVRFNLLNGEVSCLRLEAQPVPESGTKHA